MTDYQPGDEVLVTLRCKVIATANGPHYVSALNDYSCLSLYPGLPEIVDVQAATELSASKVQACCGRCGALIPGAFDTVRDIGGLSMRSAVAWRCATCSIKDIR